MSAYRFRESLGEEDLRKLTEKFRQTGLGPGVVAHYQRLDGKGGFLIEEVPEDLAAGYEFTLRYAPWLDWEVYPIATMEDAFPVLERVYG